MRTAQRILFADASEREGLARKAGQQHLMIGNLRINVRCGLFIAGWRGGERNVANIAVEAVLVGAAVMIGAIGFDRGAVPLAGEHAFAANSIKAGANATDAGEQIDKTKQRTIVMGGAFRQQRLQHFYFDVQQRTGARFAVDVAVEAFARPVVGTHFAQRFSDRLLAINIDGVLQQVLILCELGLLLQQMFLLQPLCKGVRSVHGDSLGSNACHAITHLTQRESARDQLLSSRRGSPYCLPLIMTFRQAVETLKLLSFASVP